MIEFQKGRTVVKRKWIKPLLIACISLVLVFLLWGGLTVYRAWERGLDPEIFGKGYCIDFHAYTHSSGHGSDTPWYGLTRQGYCAFAMVNDAPYALSMEEMSYDPKVFGSQFIGDGYWQDRFNVSYINEKSSRTWYGENEDHNAWLLELEDGMLMLAQGYKRDGENWEITGVDIIEPVCSQEAYFQFWNDWHEMQYQKRMESQENRQWLETHPQYQGKDPYWEKWKEFYKSYH